MAKLCEKVRKFMNQQKKLAEKLGKAVKASTFELKYVELFPANCYEPVREIAYSNTANPIISGSKVVVEETRKEKRIKVEMYLHFDRKFDFKYVIGKANNILKTNANYEKVGNCVVITYTKDPNHI